MQIEIIKQIGQITKRNKATTTYRKSPAHFDNAIYAALHYAIKHNDDMVVIPGNSYGKKVYHITTVTDSVKKYTIKSSNNTIGLVTPEGKVFQAIANEG